MKYIIIVALLVLLVGCAKYSEQTEDNATSKPRNAVIVNDIIRNTTKVP